MPSSMLGWLRGRERGGRRGESGAPTLAVVGLGNPGPKYAGTRHNAGYNCVDLLADRLGARFSDKRKTAVLAEGRVEGSRVVLVKPRTFMNASGEAARYVLDRYRIAPAAMLIVLDDLDLPVGGIRMRASGGLRRAQRAELDQRAPGHERVPPAPHRHRTAPGRDDQPRAHRIRRRRAPRDGRGRRARRGRRGGMAPQRRRLRDEPLQLAMARLLPAALLLLALAAACGDARDAPPTPEPVATPTPAPTATPTATPAPASPPAPATPTATAAAQAPRVVDVSDAPEGDIFALARRYRGVDAEPLPLGDVFPDEAVGDARSFQGLDLDGDRVFTFDAEVMHVSANATWWFPPGADVDAEDVRSAAREFEERILPGVVRLVAPGLELPGRIAVVHADFPGVAGYFNGADALPASVAPISNERVALYMALPPGSEPFTRLYYYGVLAHELQHLVHWLVDPSEDAWAQEALSELAARELGYPGIPFEPYLRRPEVSVTDWPADVEQALPNYAGASLFAAYLTERLGGDFPARLTAQLADGAAGVEAASPGDDFRELYADWLTANVARASAPPYGYESLTGSPVVRRSLREPGTLAGRAPQYGQWLLDLRPDAPWEVTFASGGPAPLLPDAPPRRRVVLVEQSRQRRRRDAHARARPHRSRAGGAHVPRVVADRGALGPRLRCGVGRRGARRGPRSPPRGRRRAIRSARRSGRPTRERPAGGARSASTSPPTRGATCCCGSSSLPTAPSITPASASTTWPCPPPACSTTRSRTIPAGAPTASSASEAQPCGRTSRCVSCRARARRPWLRPSRRMGMDGRPFGWRRGLR